MKNIANTINNYRKELMGIAAIWIFVFHVWRPIFNVKIIGTLEYLIKATGFVGVDIFFFLSGLGLPKSYETSKSIKEFYYKRIRRILIPYFIASLLIWFHNKWSFLEYILNFVGINFYIKNIYSLLWFMPAIISVYIFFPFYYRLLNKSKRSNVFIIISIMVWFVFSFFLKDFIRTDFYGFLNRIPVFLFGLMLYINKDKFYFSKEIVIILFVMLAIGLVLSYLTNIDGIYLILPESNRFLPNIFITLSLCPLLALLLSLFEFKYLKKILIFYGKMSLEMYCLQELLKNVIVTKYRYFGDILLNLILIVVTTILAHVLYLINKRIWKL